MTDMCPERMPWNVSGICGKPVKRRGFCGMHANVHDRRDAEAQKWEERRKRQALHATEATKANILRTLLYHVGVTAEPSTGVDRTDRFIRLSVDEAAKLVAVLHGDGWEWSG